MKRLHLARIHRSAGAEFMPFAGCWIGSEVEIEIHGRPRRARAVSMPFYTREYRFGRVEGA